MLKKLLTTAFVVLAVATLSYAQSGSVSGVVKDAKTGETLPGANVVLKPIQRGAATDANGHYIIKNVPNGTYTLKISFTGYNPFTKKVQINNGQTVVNAELKSDFFGLNEVVVTGVSKGTETKKLGFSVDKISEKDLQEVPATNAADALRGKAPGIEIVSASGDPSSAPTIRFRGTTSITGDSSPLIIVDGVITSGNLNDINMQDVKSIEVTKGAAASSLYGSLAGNGVIQITTKSNSEQSTETQVTVKSEYGFSQIAKDYPVATKHPFTTQGIQLTSNGKYVKSWPNAQSYDSDRRFDNDFPVLYDNVNAIFTGKPYDKNYVSIANTANDFNYSASYEGLNQGGVIEPADPYKRDNVHLNANYTPSDKFNIHFTGSYIKVDAPRYNEQGQGNFFYSALTAMPYMDMTEKNSNGEYAFKPTGYDIQNSNWVNPLYVASHRTYKFTRDRLITGANAEFNITDNLSVHGSQSLDKSWRYNTTFYPTDYKSIDPNSTTTLGQEDRRSITDSRAVTQLWAQFEKQFNNFNFSSTAKFLHEDQKYETFNAFGYGYPVPGIRDMSALENDSYSISSNQHEIVATNWILSTNLDYKDKIIAGGVIQRNGSSLFGPKARWNTYYRGSLAYRITEDLDIPNINEWKIRASYGTSGNRPPFQAQYETYSVSSTGVSPDILGNNEIKPSTIGELEVGTNITFLQRLNFKFNYAETHVKNDYLNVPLPANSGYNSQWQNVGELYSNTYEVSLAGQIINTKDISWRANVNWSRTRQKYTDLGPVPAYTRSLGGTAIDIFRVQEGEPYGSMYGNIALTSLDQLTVVNGQVMNWGVDTNGDGQLTTDDYMVNSDGYVVPKGTHGTQQEQVVYKVDKKGEKVNGYMGNTQPDFQAGFSTTFNYKGLSFHALVDWVQGPDVYNYTKQLLMFNNRHKQQQIYGANGYDVAYADGSSHIYNSGSPSSYFVEDASFVKLRELSLSYTLPNSLLGSLANTIDRIKLTVAGENLFTWTDYSGWDPEVALRTNATNFRLDEYSYPNFRTLKGSIEVRF